MTHRFFYITVKHINIWHPKEILSLRRDVAWENVHIQQTRILVLSCKRPQNGKFLDTLSGERIESKFFIIFLDKKFKIP